MASITEILGRLFGKAGRSADADAGSAGRTTVVVGRLLGDSDGVLTRRLTDAVDRASPNIKVRALAEHVPLTAEGQPALRLATAEGTVRALALEHEAEVVVWGAVDPSSADGAYRLGFMGAVVPPMGRARPYALGDTLVLPANLGDIHIDVLRAAVAAAVQPMTEKVNRDRIALGRASIEPLEHFLASPPDGLPPLQLASILEAYANLALMLGETGGPIFWFDRAIEAYRRRQETAPRGADPFGWAMAQIGLGSALQLTGEHSPKSSRIFDEAVEAVRGALEVLTKESYPLRWALASANLGDLLTARGRRSEATADLEAAVAAHQAALSVFSQPMAPLRWAGLQHNLGNALNALSQRELGTSRLAEIVAAYSEALKVRTRGNTPLLWAETQAALAAALFRVGKLIEKRELLEAAQKGFDQALEVFEEHPGQQAISQMIKRELLRVERLLETRATAQSVGPAKAASSAAEAPAKGTPNKKPPAKRPQAPAKKAPAKQTG